MSSRLIGKKFFREIENLGNRIVRGMRDRLAKNGSNASGKLSQSIDFRYFEANTDKITLKFSLRKYYKFVEHGRGPGKRPPQRKIKGWIRDKGISTGDKSIKSTAFLIARKIGNEGTRAQPFVKPTLREQKPIVRKRLGNVIAGKLKFLFNQNL